MATQDRDERRPGPPDDDRPELSARVTTTSDGTTECTIFPTNVPEAERTTRWITAAEDGFLNFEELL